MYDFILQIMKILLAEIANLFGGTKCIRHLNALEADIFIECRNMSKGCLIICFLIFAWCHSCFPFK